MQGLSGVTCAAQPSRASKMHSVLEHVGTSLSFPRMACVCQTEILPFADYDRSGAGIEGQASVWAVKYSNGNTRESLASSGPTQAHHDSVITWNKFSAFCYDHFLSHRFSINVY